MKIIATIEARMGSSRLPGKTLMNLNGKPMLQVLLDRVKKSKLLNDVVVATTVNEKDNEIEDFCKKNKYNYFRGREDDVLERVLKTAQNNKADIIVELTGDNPLVDPEIIDEIVKFYLDNNYDYVCNFLPKSFPQGAEIQVFSTKVLEKVDVLGKEPVDRENVSWYIYQHPEKYKIGNVEAWPEVRDPNLRISVDYKEDFELVEKIIKSLKNEYVSLKDIVKFIRDNPELKKLNDHRLKGRKMYNAAIVGLGRMGQMFENDGLIKKPCTHAGVYTYMKNKINLVAACDLREDRLNIFKDKWNVDHLYKDYKEMLKKEKIDILSISTHAPEHKEIVVEAVKAGVKAIFCEKPISTNLKDAEEMIKACKENNVVLYIDHTRRFDNLWRKAKELIDNGSIGEIKSINAYSTAGLLNGGTHLFDLLRFYNGDVESVFAKLIKDNTNDASGVGFLKFKNGTTASIDIDIRDYSLFQINIIGSKGLLRCGGMIRGGKSFELWTPKPSPTQTGIIELQSEDFPEVKGEMALVNAVNEIIESIETGKKSVSDGEDGYKALEIGLAFHESDKLGKEVKLPLQNKDITVMPRETSFTKDGKLPLLYTKHNILPPF